MGKNRKDTEQISQQVTSGVAEKDGCLWEVVRQKTEQSPARQECDEGDEILALRCCCPGEKPGGNRTQTRAKTVHVIHEIERIRHGNDPQDGDRITKRE